MMSAVLYFSNHHRLAGYTGLFAGLLVATYITLEAPFSGMSMNPARTFGSAFPPMIWDGLWIYLTAPPLGMLAAAEFYLWREGTAGGEVLQASPQQRQALHILRSQWRIRIMTDNRYDVIIIGTGAGGGTLAYHLAPSGKRILILERGDYVPREKANWDPQVVNVDAHYNTKESWLDKDGKDLHPAHQLLRRRQHQVLRRGAVPSAQRGFRRTAPPRRHLTGMADQL